MAAAHGSTADIPELVDRADLPQSVLMIDQVVIEARQARASALSLLMEAFASRLRSAVSSQRSGSPWIPLRDLLCNVHDH